MRVNELAKLLHVSPETIRFYTREGYLRPNKNPVNGYKEYGVGDQARMRFIVSARALGFTVTDIGEILQVTEKSQTPCPVVRQLIEQRLRETEAQFEATRRLRNRMRQAVTDWRELPDKEPTGHMLCHLIEFFSESESAQELDDK